jgi:ribosomal protein L7Ae-like RNA K-turn-binding protein
VRRKHAPVPAGPERPPRQALLDLLGLAARARALVTGTDMTRQKVRDGEAFCVLVAADASPTQRKKVEPLVLARGIPCFITLTRDEIGAAIGKAPVSAVGFTHDRFAKRAAELAAAIETPQDD